MGIERGGSYGSNRVVPLDDVEPDGADREQGGFSGGVGVDLARVGGLPGDADVGPRCRVERDLRAGEADGSHAGRDVVRRQDDRAVVRAADRVGAFREPEQAHHRQPSVVGAQRRNAPGLPGLDFRGVGGPGGQGRAHEGDEGEGRKQVAAPDARA